jgi:chlorobactene glucosyltransferase
VGIFVILLLAANVIFAARSIVIALRSRVAIEPAPVPLDAPRVSIVVPARNEEYQIERCVRSLLAQEHPHLDVIVVDDQSQDATASIVEMLAREDDRLRLIPGEALPEGWVGKPWALHQGLRYAGGDWVLFTDADTIHDPGALAAALGFARAHEIDVLSLLTRQIMATPAEQLLLPSILFTIGFAIGSLDSINDMERENALFNGQYILARRAAFEAIGGHEAVRNEIAEDLELARKFKADGRFRTALVRSNGLVRVRMYRNFGELWEGFVKNFWVGARDRPALALLGIAFLACLSPITPVAILIALALHAWSASALLACAVAVAILGAAYGMAGFGMPRYLAACLPIGIAATVAIAATSIVRRAFGGVAWRGRRYAA